AAKPEKAAAVQAIASSERTRSSSSGRAHAAAGKSAGAVKYHGDASIAARHNHLKVHRAHPVHAAQVSHGRSASPPGHVRAKPKTVPPGPYEAGPPPKSHAHSRPTGGGGSGGGASHRGGDGEGKEPQGFPRRGGFPGGRAPRPPPRARPPPRGPRAPLPAPPP